MKLNDNLIKFLLFALVVGVVIYILNKRKKSQSVSAKSVAGNSSKVAAQEGSANLPDKYQPTNSIEEKILSKMIETVQRSQEYQSGALSLDDIQELSFGIMKNVKSLDDVEKKAALDIVTAFDGIVAASDKIKDQNAKNNYVNARLKAMDVSFSKKYPVDKYNKAKGVVMASNNEAQRIAQRATARLRR